jgi:protein O-GlcNAc transferase
MDRSTGATHAPIDCAMLAQLIDYLRHRIQLVARCHIHMHSRDTEMLLREAEVCDRHNDVKGAQKALYRALKLDPRHGEALYRMGQIAQRAGQTDAAIEWIAKAIAARPQAASFYNTYGNLKFEQGKNDEAEQSYLTAIALRPNLAEPYANLGMILCERGEFLEGVRLFRKAVGIDPQLYYAHHNLGNAHYALGEYVAAVASYRRALEINLGAFETQYSLGTSLQAMGNLDAAEAAYRRALELKPDHAETHYRLGNVLCEIGRLDDAYASLGRAVHLQPAMYKAYNGLGIVLLKQDKLEDAISTLNDAIALRPDYAVAHNNLGMALQRHGRPGDAIAAYRRALEAKPDFSEAHSNLIHALAFMPDMNIGEEQAERRRWWERHVQAQRFAAPRHDNTPDPDRRLRIGYVSADFGRHSAATAFGMMLLKHDRSLYEVTCYSNSAYEDDVTARFRGSVDRWRTIAGMSDASVAELIHSDGIDVLVDLSGHSAGNRLLVFARRTAPVQVTAWGHATGTGLREMDYLFSDETMIPPQSRRHFSEEIFYLPCAISYLPLAEPPPIEPLPAQRNGHVTVGFFNNYAKISDNALNLWGKLLAAVSDSRILLKAKELGFPGPQRQRVLGRLTEAGIAQERVRFVGGTSWYEHMAAHSEADIAIDPFPYGGGVSTFEALWMGVPVVTLKGTAVSHRASASILTAAGMADWVAETPQQYIEIVTSNMKQVQQLQALRTALRQRLLHSPLADSSIYVRAVELAYRDMWRKWCRGRHSSR